MKLFGRKSAPPAPTQPLSEESVRATLKTVMDPEIGINIVDLGLIYGLRVTPERIDVTMTMTTPTCPMGDLLMDDIEAALGRLAPQAEVYLELVWEPPWSPEKMSPEARDHFGWQDEAPE